MKRWPALADEGTDTYTIDWTQKLPSGVTLSSVAYEADPNNGLTFAINTVVSNISSIAITAAKGAIREFQVKCTPTLSSGSISPISVPIKVIKHKPAR